MKSTWLTDPTVPNATTSMAKRKSRFRTKTARVWLPQEASMWLHGETGLIFYARPGDITDFASTPAGDGSKGVLRGAGRLHDLMNDQTPVLVPNRVDAYERLIATTLATEPGRFPSVAEVVLCGYTMSRKRLSIWHASKLYSEMLMSAGFPKWRAILQRAGLRGLRLQHVYRWAFNDSPWVLI